MDMGNFLDSKKFYALMCIAIVATLVFAYYDPLYSSKIDTPASPPNQLRWSLNYNGDKGFAEVVLLDNNSILARFNNSKLRAYEYRCDPFRGCFSEMVRALHEEYERGGI